MLGPLSIGMPISLNFVMMFLISLVHDKNDDWRLKFDQLYKHSVKGIVPHIKSLLRDVEM